MAYYDLNTNSSDLIQSNGSSITPVSTNYDNGIVKGGGTAPSTGPLGTVDPVKVHSGEYGGVKVAGIRGSVGPVNRTLVEEGSIDQGTGQWVGYAEVETNSPNTLQAGDIVVILDGDTGKIYSGTYRILAKITNASFIINKGYVSDSDPITVYNIVPKSATDSSPKDIGNIIPGNYYTKYVGTSIYNGVSTVNPLVSTASEGVRNKVHNRKSVRTSLIENAIRNGDWNIYTGQFNTLISTQNDFSAFGVDNETEDDTLYGLKGEFIYRYGITIQNDY